MQQTNRPDVLDKALLRPHGGRFDRQIVVSAPDVKAKRRNIRSVHAKKKTSRRCRPKSRRCKNTSGFCRSRFRKCIKWKQHYLQQEENKTEIAMREIEDAMVKATMGPEKKTRVRSEKENKLVAYHEAGTRSSSADFYQHKIWYIKYQ